MQPGSRPHTYTPKIAAIICRRIADGESLRAICGPKRRRGIPERVTVYNWLHRFPPFMKAYLLARRAQAELYLDEVVEIADGRDDGAVGAREVSRDRLRVEARLKISALMAPRIGGGAGLEPVEPDAPAQALDRQQRAARIAAILEAARVRGEAEGG